MPGLIADRLVDRVRRDPASPFLTYYDLTSAERTELSARTFANWVDKTANLLLDLGVEPGEGARLDLLATVPGHWVSLVWVAACWRAGVAVRVPPGSLGSADPAVPGHASSQLGLSGPGPSGPGSSEGLALVVCGPELPAAPVPLPVVACSLHPLGLGFPAPPPSPVVDFGREVPGQPDAYLGPAPLPGLPAWSDGERALDQDGLLTAAEPAAGPAGRPVRRLVRPTTAWPTVRSALLDPVLDGGSSVVVVGGGADAVTRVAAAERVSAPAG